MRDRLSSLLEYVLAAVATELNLVVGLQRLVNRLGLLGVVDEALLAVGVDTGGLVVDETSVLMKQNYCQHPMSSGFLSACAQMHPCSSVSRIDRSYLAGVLVDQVKRVTGELDTTGLLALDQEGVVVACISYSLDLFFLDSGCCCYPSTPPPIATGLNTYGQSPTRGPARR